MDLGTKLIVAIGTATVLVQSLSKLISALCSLVKKSRTLGKEVAALFKKTFFRSTWNVLTDLFKKILVRNARCFFKKILFVACNILFKKVKSVTHVTGYLLKQISKVDTLLALEKKLLFVAQHLFKKSFLREVHALFEKTFGVLINTLLTILKKLSDVTVTPFLKKLSLFTGERDILKKPSFVAATSGEFDNLLLVCPRCYYMRCVG